MFALYHNFQPKYLPADSKLEAALSNTNVMNFFGMDLASSCSEVFSRQGVVAAIPYVVLIIIVGATSFIQQRQIQGRNPTAQINPQQQQIMKIMPFFLPIISIGLPSGLVLYFAVSNLFRVGQQWFIGRTIYGTGKGGSGERAAKELASSESSEDKPARRGGATPATSAAKSAKGAKSAPASKAGTKTPAKGREADRAKAGQSATSSGDRGRAKGGSAPADKANDDARSRGSSRTGGRPPQGKPASKPAGKGGSDTSGRNGDAPRKQSNGSAPGDGDGGSPTLQPRARKKKR